jgi:8-oxo-dGTP pyrophosphatase MutT (NUDIX family)
MTQRLPEIEIIERDRIEFTVEPRSPPFAVARRSEIDRTLDIDRNLRRELMEETGLDLGRRPSDLDGRMRPCLRAFIEYG